MAVHKLMDWELDKEPFILIAIHSIVEPYRMAFLINRFLHVNFARTAVDQDIIEPAYTANYPVYKHFDKEHNAPFYLIPNKYWGVSNEESESLSLFDKKDASQVQTVLIKEYGSVDYLLKIEKEEDFFPLKELIHTLGEIPQVLSVYTVDIFKIKQQDYLIFE